MSTLTAEETQKIADWLDEHPHLSVGVGTTERACSVAAINLALTGELTDTIPDCMSPVVGNWIIEVQDAMPALVRDSIEWRGLLPLAAGTGRDREQERLAIVMDWMWGTVLPHVQGLADRSGFSVEWRRMTEERSPEAARAAADASWAVPASWAAAWVADAGDAALAGYMASAATLAGRAARAAARAAAAWSVWSAFDPVGLLRRLVALSDD